jgi:hypothetical protein
VERNGRAMAVYGVIAMAVVAIVLAVALGQDDGGQQPPQGVRVQVNAGQDGAPTETLTVPTAVFNGAAATFPDRGMRDETPALAEKAAPEQLAAVRRAVDRNRRTTTPLPTAGASGGFQGCVTHFVRNQSSRNGVRPTVQVLHYTVSHNIPNSRADVEAITALFDRSSAQASSNFVIDAEGHCDYIVPIENKAWTQAGGNPWAISYEVVAYGNEAAYMATPGYLKLARVMLEVSKRTGIPLQAGAISGCVPSKPGTVQHLDGGICWGGHHDISPFSKAQVIAIVQRLAHGGAPIGRRQIRRCHRLNHLRRRSARYHRRHGWPPAKHPLTRREKRLAKRILAGERRFKLRCRVKRTPHLVRA